MDIELKQFQKDLLESLREVKASRLSPAFEDRPLHALDCLDDVKVLSSAKHHKIVLPNLIDCDT